MFNELNVHLCAYESVLNFAEIIGDESVGIATEGIGITINKIWIAFKNFFINIGKWIKNFVVIHLGKTLVHSETFERFEKAVIESKDVHTKETNEYIDKIKKAVSTNLFSDYPGFNLTLEYAGKFSDFDRYDPTDDYSKSLLEKIKNAKSTEFRLLNNRDIAYITSAIHAFELNAERLKTFFESTESIMGNDSPGNGKDFSEGLRQKYFPIYIDAAIKKTNRMMKWFVAMQYRKAENDKIVHLNEKVSVTLNPVNQY